MSFTVVRVFIILLCSLAGYSISQVRPELLNAGLFWTLIGFAFGVVLVVIDELLKGFSLRQFSAATFGLALGSAVAWMVDQSQIFIFVEESTLWMIRLFLFIGFGYIGIILAMRSNNEDFALIIPYVRFTRQDQPATLFLLDTSVIIDGRIQPIIESQFLSGTFVIPRFVLKELQQVADSSNPEKRARGKLGLETLSLLQKSDIQEIKIHEGDVPEETEVDLKLVMLAKMLSAKLVTNDNNLGKIAELQGVKQINIHDLSQSLRKIYVSGEEYSVRIIKEGKDPNQGVGYFPDGTMVVVNEGGSLIGKEIEIQLISTIKTGSGTMVFAQPKPI